MLYLKNEFVVIVVVYKKEKGCVFVCQEGET
jgi:hypothetical protein